MLHTGTQVRFLCVVFAFYLVHWFHRRLRQSPAICRPLLAMREQTRQSKEAEVSSTQLDRCDHLTEEREPLTTQTGTDCAAESQVANKHRYRFLHFQDGNGPNGSDSGAGGQRSSALMDEPDISPSQHNKETRNLKIELFHSLCITRRAVELRLLSGHLHDEVIHAHRRIKGAPS